MGYVYKQQKSSKFWTIGFTNEHGKQIRRSSGTTNKAAAWKIVAAEEEAVHLRKMHGVAPSPMESRTPIMEVVCRYLDDCIEYGNTRDWVELKRRRLIKVVAWTGVQTIAELGRDEIRLVFDVHLSDAAKSTRNAYLSNIRELCSWAMEQDLPMISSNPTDLMRTRRRRSKRAENIDAAEKRRCLWTPEIPMLLRARPDDPRARISWDNHRRPLYIIAMGTGLRRGTLNEITPAMIKLDVANPHIDIPGGLMKSGRQLRMPVVDPAVRSSIEQLLRNCSKRKVLLSGKNKNWHERPFAPVPLSWSTFRNDIERAGIPRIDEDGRKVVFHSLRATFATQLALNGAKPIETKELMDHQKIETTMRYYLMVGITETFDAMRKLPSLDQGSLEEAVVAMSKSMSIA